MGEIKYRTQHREELLSYLKTIRGQHFTVADLHAHFLEIGKPMGTTTVYRQLERLVDDGVVSKYVIDPNTSACFEYTGEKQEREEQLCVHCKCERCGRLIHLHCEEMQMIELHLRAHHHFLWNPLRTVFYGICEDCRAEKKRKNFLK